MRLGDDLTPEVGDGGEVHPDADLEQEEGQEGDEGVRGCGPGPGRHAAHRHGHRHHHQHRFQDASLAPAWLLYCYITPAYLLVSITQNLSDWGWRRGRSRPWCRPWSRRRPCPGAWRRCQGPAMIAMRGEWWQLGQYRGPEEDEDVHAGLQQRLARPEQQHLSHGKLLNMFPQTKFAPRHFS